MAYELVLISTFSPTQHPYSPLGLPSNITLTLINCKILFRVYYLTKTGGITNTLQFFSESVLTNGYL